MVVYESGESPGVRMSIKMVNQVFTSVSTVTKSGC